MRGMSIIFVLLLLGCQTKQPTTSNLLLSALTNQDAGWERVCGQVPRQTRDIILDSLSLPYYNKTLDYEYFGLHILKPLADGQRPIVLETTLEGQSWVRMFTFRANHLVFIRESAGSVFGIESDTVSAVIRMLVRASQAPDSSTIVLHELHSSLVEGVLHYSTATQYVVTRSSVARLAKGRGA